MCNTFDIFHILHIYIMAYIYLCIMSYISRWPVHVLHTLHMYVSSRTPHQNLLGTQRVSNSATRKDLGRVLALIKNTRNNGTNQTKEGHRGRNPASKKLLVRYTTNNHKHTWASAHNIVWLSHIIIMNSNQEFVTFRWIMGIFEYHERNE